MNRLFICFILICATYSIHAQFDPFAADYIEIYQLNPKVTKKTIGFPIHPYKKEATIIETTTVSGEDAAGIARYWLRIGVGYKYSADCHYPGFGLRFFSKKKMIFETSMCWKCSNLYMKNKKGKYAWRGFDASRTASKNLLWFLQRLITFKRCSQILRIEDPQTRKRMFFIAEESLKLEKALRNLSQMRKRAKEYPANFRMLKRTLYQLNKIGDVIDSKHLKLLVYKVRPTLRTEKYLQAIEQVPKFIEEFTNDHDPSKLKNLDRLIPTNYRIPPQKK